MAKKDFCCVDNFSVLIPYKDLEKLLNIAQNYEETNRELKKAMSRLDEQFTALKIQFSETLEKLQELEELI